MPKIGSTYEMYPPFRTVRVTHFVRNWIYIEPADDRASFDDDPAAQGRVPNRVKRKHWTGRLKAVSP